MKVFEVNRKRLVRAQKQLEERGSESFFASRGGRKASKVMTPQKLKTAQRLLNDYLSRGEVAEEIGVSKETLRKAINDGRLYQPKKPEESTATTTDMSDRSDTDAKAGAGMGVACTNPVDRVAAAVGMIDGVKHRFKSCKDVVLAGVLCGIPAILQNGLLTQACKLGAVSGYYTKHQILLTLVIMMLTRIKNVEQLRGYSPGELGKLIGLDRIPEGRCLRNKMETLSTDGQAAEWSRALSQEWLQESEAIQGFLYVDGHVKVYTGQHKIPRKFVSRQRLCLRGISQYWIGDAIGQPILMVEKQIDTGMIDTLNTDLIPRLKEDIPASNQPTQAELDKDPLLHRFVLVCDREGSSHVWFKSLWDEHRIACMTYAKNVQDKWPEQEFSTIEILGSSNESVIMKIAERGVFLGEERFPVKEVRRLTESGHQTAIYCTARKLEPSRIAPGMFNRWTQENFFGYALEHFNIDGLISNKTQEHEGTKILVNPKWRALEKEQRKLRGKLQSTQVKYLNMDTQKRADTKHKNYPKWKAKKEEYHEAIESYQEELQQLKSRKTQTQKHVKFEKLNDEERFAMLNPDRRTLTNTIGMIAYRSETALAQILINQTSLDLSHARAVLQDLFRTPANIFPDEENKVLHIQLHTLSTPKDNQHIQTLLDILNQTETTFPETDLVMQFKSAHVHSDL